MVNPGQARKRFGQHFLIDQGVIANIVDAIDPQPEQKLIEIGPGRAALTAALLSRVPAITAIEIDRDLVHWLQARWPAKALRLIEHDALTFDYRSVSANAGTSTSIGTSASASASLRLVGNLPYNISSPLLIYLIGFRDCVVDQHFMLQKEVVDRIAAAPGASAYGRLTVLLQAFYQVQSLCEVAPSAFEPPPKVVSSVIRMRPLTRTRQVPQAALELLTARAFAHKRKMLRTTLLPWLQQLGVDHCAIAPTARAEEVSVSVYCDLARSISSIL